MRTLLLVLFVAVLGPHAVAQESLLDSTQVPPTLAVPVDTLPPPPVAPQDVQARPTVPVEAPMTQAQADSLLRQVAAMQRQLALVGGVVGANQDSIRALNQTRRDSNAVRRAVDAVNDVAKEAGQTVRNVGLKFVLSVILLVLTMLAVRGTVTLLEALAGRSAERRLFYKKLIPIARLLLWTMAAYLVIAVIFQIDSQGLFAAITAVGVGVAFAAQDILKNIFGGLVIIFDQPFQVGDKIAVGSSYGEVVSIGMRSTRITTPDDNLVTVPNSQVVDGQVSNANAGALDCQVVTDLYLPGWVDVRLAKRIAYEAAANSRFVYLDKPIVIICKDEVNETFLLHLKVKAYVLDTRYEFLLMSDITEAAKAEFLRHGLLTPMPLRPVLGPSYPDPSGSNAGASPQPNAAEPRIVTPSDPDGDSR